MLKEIALGNRDAFTVLMRRYLARMVTLAQRIVFDHEQAREIAQEAFLRVWKHAHKWDVDGTATFHTWLRRVVVNLSISQRRRHREQVSLDFIEELPTSAPDGFFAQAQSEEKQIVSKALQSLNERQRAAIALYYYEELSQNQAAEIMGITQRSFDSLMVRARASLKQYLADAGLGHQEDKAS